MSERVEFLLSMPNVGSWNGKWSGASRRYAIKRNLTNKYLEKMTLPNSWYHSFGDGWAASVSARIMEPGERFRKSDGFCGYDWMVDNIVWYGRIESCVKPEDHIWMKSHGEEGWERCNRKGCGRSRKIQQSVESK